MYNFIQIHRGVKKMDIWISSSESDITDIPPVNLYLNFEKSSWKTQVQQTGFLQATQAVKIQFQID